MRDNLRAMLRYQVVQLVSHIFSHCRIHVVRVAIGQTIASRIELINPKQAVLSARACLRRTSLLTMRLRSHLHSSYLVCRELH